MGQPTGPRNQNGVKDSSDCWRTIKGVRWPSWAIQPSDILMAAYRANGVRCRKITHKDGSFDAFIHPDDKEKAMAVDEEFDARESAMILENINSANKSTG